LLWSGTRVGPPPPTSLRPPPRHLPRVRPPSPTPMAAPSHLHLPGCPQTLALPLPWPRGFSAPPGLLSRSRRLRPVAALGPADAGDLLGRVEALLYTVADAAVSAEPVAAAGTKEAAAGDWLSGITNSMETVLKVRSRPPRASRAMRFRASVPAAIGSGLRGLCRGCVSCCGCFPVPCEDASPLFCLFFEFSFWDFFWGNGDCEVTVTPTPFCAQNAMARQYEC
jgi:hypothetical protein